MKQTEILTHATHVNGWFPAVYMSCMSQNFRLFHVSNLSVRNFRIFLLMYTGSVKWRVGADSSPADAGGVPSSQFAEMTAAKLAPQYHLPGSARHRPRLALSPVSKPARSIFPSGRLTWPPRRPHFGHESDGLPNDRSGQAEQRPDSSMLR